MPVEPGGKGPVTRKLSVPGIDLGPERTGVPVELETMAKVPDVAVPRVAENVTDAAHPTCLASWTVAGKRVPPWPPRTLCRLSDNADWIWCLVGWVPRRLATGAGNHFKKGRS